MPEHALGTGDASAVSASMSIAKVAGSEAIRSGNLLST
jgi:hypothetical protein